MSRLGQMSHGQLHPCRRGCQHVVCENSAGDQSPRVALVSAPPHHCRAGAATASDGHRPCVEECRMYHHWEGPRCLWGYHKILGLVAEQLWPPPIEYRCAEPPNDVHVPLDMPLAMPAAARKTCWRAAASPVHVWGTTSLGWRADFCPPLEKVWMHPLLSRRLSPLLSPSPPAGTQIGPE